MEKIPEPNAGEEIDLPEEISTPEVIDKEVFDQYVEELQLSPEDLKKIILDVGSDTSEFSQYARERNINKGIVSIDSNPSFQTNINNIKASADALPFKDGTFELTISTNSIPHVLRFQDPEDVRRQVNDALSEMLRVTKDGGEIRLASVPKGERFDKDKIFSEILEDALKSLKEDHGVTIEEIPTPEKDSYQTDDDGNLTQLNAKAYLIKIHKPKIAVDSQK